MTIDEAKESSDFFINTAFNLLSAYKSSRYVRTYGETIPLEESFALTINDNGQLYIIDEETGKTVAHSFNHITDKISYVGVLLSKYLKLLQKDE